VIGTMQATEVLKELMGLGESMSGNLLVFDGMGMTFQKIRYKRSANCPLCGDAPTITAVGALGPV
jgi:molybdopterin/thiamine biosynthesis adenylyltransferase